MAYRNEHGRAEPPVAGNETDTFLGSLERLRSTLEWKCSGLDAAGMRATLGSSSVTLGGLLKHLAVIEDYKHSVMLMGRELDPVWPVASLEADPDWDWHSAGDDTPEQLLSLWRGAVDRSRATLAEALADGGLDRAAAFTTRSGESPSLRRILIDLVEEYSRHVGHADLVRESVDGLVGEDPP